MWPWPLGSGTATTTRMAVAGCADGGHTDAPREFAQAAGEHLRAWFLEPETLMHPPSGTPW